MEFRTVDELFTALPISDVRRILLQTHDDAIKAKHNLRSAVSTQYEDLLQTADEVNVMLLGVKKLVEKINELQTTAVTFFKTAPETAGQQAESSTTNILTGDVIVNWIHTAIETAYRCIDAHDYYRALALVLSLRALMAYAKKHERLLTGEKQQISHMSSYLYNTAEAMELEILSALHIKGSSATDWAPSAWLSAVAASTFFVISGAIHRSTTAEELTDRITSLHMSCFLTPIASHIKTTTTNTDQPGIGDKLVSASQMLILAARSVSTVFDTSSSGEFLRKVVADVHSVVQAAEGLFSENINLASTCWTQLKTLTAEAPRTTITEIVSWSASPSHNSPCLSDDVLNSLGKSVYATSGKWTSSMVQLIHEHIPKTLSKAFGLPDTLSQEGATGTEVVHSTDVTRSFTLLHELIAKLRASCQAADGAEGLVPFSVYGNTTKSAYELLFAAPLATLSRACNHAALKNRCEGLVQVVAALSDTLRELCALDESIYTQERLSLSLQASACGDVALCDEDFGIATGINSRRDELFEELLPWSNSHVRSSDAGLVDFLSNNHLGRLRQWESDVADAEWQTSVARALQKTAQMLAAAACQALQEYCETRSEWQPHTTGRTDADVVLEQQFTNLATQFGKLLQTRNASGDADGDGIISSADRASQAYVAWFVALVAANVFFGLCKDTCSEALLAAFATLTTQASAATSHLVVDYALQPVREFWTSTLRQALQYCSQGRSKHDAAAAWRQISGNWAGIVMEGDEEQSEDASHITVHVPCQPSGALLNGLHRLRSRISRLGVEPSWEHQMEAQAGNNTSAVCLDWIQLFTHTCMCDLLRVGLESIYQEALQIFADDASSSFGQVKDQAVTQALMDVFVWGHLVGAELHCTRREAPASSQSAAGRFLQSLSAAMGTASGGGAQDPLANMLPNVITSHTSAGSSQNCANLWLSFAGLIDPIELTLVAGQLESLAADAIKSHALLFSAIVPAIPSAGTVASCDGKEFCLHTRKIAGIAADDLSVTPPSWNLAEIISQVNVSSLMTPGKERAASSSSRGGTTAVAHSLAASKSTLWNPRTMLLLINLPTSVATADYDSTQSLAIPTLDSSSLPRIALLPVPVKPSSSSQSKPSLLPFSSPAALSPHGLASAARARGRKPASSVFDYVNDDGGASTTADNRDNANGRPNAKTNDSLLTLPTRLLTSSLVALTGNGTKHAKTGGEKHAPSASISGTVSSYLDLLLSADK